MDDDTLTPGTRLGPYEIEAMVGSGGMGHVYRARDPRLGRHVAIKTLPASMIADELLARRFESEARTVGALDHPNLLVVYDVGRAGDVSYIVSELLDGETVRERLRRQGPLPPRQVVELAAQIVAGLAAAHARGVVHRDLKPENLFVTRDRRLKILDFGIAKRVQPPTAGTTATAAESLTATGMIVGTVGYMAPEQMLGDAVDARADLFALGVVLHELLAGAPPFRRESAVATMGAVVGDEPPALPASVPPALARIVRRCLAKSPEDRFDSAHDVAIALEFTELSERVERMDAAPPPAAVHAPAAISRRTALGLGAGAAALAASGFAGGAYLRDRPVVAPSYRRLTFRRGLIRSARATADGQTILFGALWDGEHCRVHTVRVDGPESRPLDLPPANLLAVSRTGELALALGPHELGVITYGTLARMPLSGGAPREMIVDVKFADWSPDGSELAVVRRVDGGDQLEYPIGTPLVRPKAGEPNGLGFARVSGDGRRVAFVRYRTRDSLMGRVCVVDRSGTVTTLSPEYLNIHGLAWRGDEIWFTAADDRPLFRAVRAVSRGAPRTITRMPGNATLWDVLPDGRVLLAQTDDRAVLIARRPGDRGDRDLSWLDASWVADLSGDGRQILFSEMGQGGGADGAAYLRGSDGTPAVRLAPGVALALSPDGRWALCAAAGGASPYLDLVPTGAGEARRIAGGDLAFTGARWLPDAQRVILSAVAPGGTTRLYRLDLRGGRPEAITPAGIVGWVVSPDGRQVATIGTGRGIMLHAVDGSAARPVPGTTGGEGLLAWVDAGVLLLRPDDPAAAPGDVRVLDPATGRQAPWIDILPQDRAGIMALISFCATAAGDHRAYTWHRALSDLYLADELV